MTLGNKCSYQGNLGIKGGVWSPPHQMAAFSIPTKCYKSPLAPPKAFNKKICQTLICLGTFAHAVPSAPPPSLDWAFLSSGFHLEATTSGKPFLDSLTPLTHRSPVFPFSNWKLAIMYHVACVLNVNPGTPWPGNPMRSMTLSSSSPADSQSPAGCLVPPVRLVHIILFMDFKKNL